LAPRMATAPLSPTSSIYDHNATLRQQLQTDIEEIVVRERKLLYEMLDRYFSRLEMVLQQQSGLTRNVQAVTVPQEVETSPDGQPVQTQCKSRQPRPHPPQVVKPLDIDMATRTPTNVSDVDVQLSPDPREGAPAGSQPHTWHGHMLHEESLEDDPLTTAIKEGRGATNSCSTAAHLDQTDGNSSYRLGWICLRDEVHYEHETSWLVKMRAEIIQLTATRFTRQGRVFVTFLDRLMSIKEPMRDGPLARFVDGAIFRWLCSGVIVLNAWYVVYEANYEIQNLETGPSTFMKCMQVIFFVFYALEIFLQLLVHRAYFFCNVDCFWNVFDLLLVITSGIDLLVGYIMWGNGGRPSSINFQFMRGYRLLKISKIIRILRVVHFFSDIALMLNCILASLETLVGCLIMVCFFLYFFALFFVHLVTAHLAAADANIDDEERRLLLASFGSTQRAALSLFQATTGGVDWQDVYTLLKPVGWGAQSTLIFYIVFFVIVAWNVITSTFMEKAARLAQPDVDSLMLDRHHQDLMDAKHLSTAFVQLDKNKSGYITIEEFLEITQDPTFQKFMQVRGIDIKDAKMFFNMLVSACKSTEVDIATFIGSCLRMKGLATSIDLHTLGFEVRTIHRRLANYQNESQMMISRLESLVTLTLQKLTTSEHMCSHRVDSDKACNHHCSLAQGISVNKFQE